MDQSTSRRKLIALLIVTVPILVGIVIVLIGHFAGHENEAAKPLPEPYRAVAIAPAAPGTPAPRVRLTDGADGARYDSASLGDAPSAVVFISTRCEAIGDYLRRAVAELREDGGGAAILAISSDPKADSQQAVGAWLSKHHLNGNDPFRFLVGDEEELRGYWNAWGLIEPSSRCPSTVPAHLVSGSGENTGVIDLDPQSSPSVFTGALTGMSK